MKKHAYEMTPHDYELYKKIDLIGDKDSFRAIIIWSLLSLFAMVIPMLFVHPIAEALNMPLGKTMFCIGATAIGIIVYIFLHEGIHGIFIRLFTGDSASYGMEIKNGIAYASSRWLFAKWPYIVIAAAPVVVLGIIIGLLIGDVSEQYFWYMYIIQILNITGAAGDLYIICMAVKMPKNVLILDKGKEMNFYLPKTTKCE